MKESNQKVKINPAYTINRETIYRTYRAYTSWKDCNINFDKDAYGVIWLPQELIVRQLSDIENADDLLQNCQRARIFDKTQEILIWRTDKLKYRSIQIKEADARESDTEDLEYICSSPQIREIAKSLNALKVHNYISYDAVGKVIVEDSRFIVDNTIQSNKNA